MKIYFDGVLLDEDNYIEFTVDQKQFENEFYLGSAASIRASLVIPSDAFTTAPNEVVVKINNTDYYHLVIDSIEETDNAEIRLNLTDKLINTDVQYDFSSLVPISAINLLNAICTEFSISHDTFNFTNKNVTISSYDNTYTAREYISMIAELAGGYAYIDNVGKLRIENYTNNNITNIITYDDVDTFKLGETITIERITYEFAARKYESSNDDTLYTIVLNPNNLFLQVATDSELDDLSDNIIGFHFNNIKIDTCNLFYQTHVIKFNNGEFDYYILNQFNNSFCGGFIGSYETTINNTKEEFTKILTPDEKIRSIKQTIAEDELTITATRDDISRLEATVNADGVLLHVLANDSNINVEYDPITGEPISGTLQEVTTTNGLQFNSGGLFLFNDENDYVAQHTPTGTFYKDGNTILGRYTKDGSDLKNLGLYGVYSYGKETIDEPSLFVAQKYQHNINGVMTPGFGHFYNGGNI